MIIGLRHVGIVVSDIDTAIGFYVDLLGFTVARCIEEKSEYLDRILGQQGAHIYSVKMTDPNGVGVDLVVNRKYESGCREQRPLHDELGYSHIALLMSDLDSEYLRLLKAGVRFSCAPQLSPDKFALVTFCFDPDGNPVELVQLL